MMPPVVGFDVSPAVQTIAAAGLRPEKPVRTYNGAPAGTVTLTVPQAGTMVLAGSRVAVFVSRGIGVCLQCSGGGVVLKMPAVCGLSFEQAAALLVQDNITVSTRPIRRASSEPPGTVIGSVPRAHTPFLAYGSRNARKVVLTISSAEAGSPTPGGQTAC
jgi:beta-lactam-binding protein with PASTA domain